jgi:hypothetical protein
MTMIVDFSTTLRHSLLYRLFNWLPANSTSPRLLSSHLQSMPDSEKQRMLDQLQAMLFFTKVRFCKFFKHKIIIFFFDRCISLPQDHYIIGLMLRGGMNFAITPEEVPVELVKKVEVPVCEECNVETSKSCSMCMKLICEICFGRTHNAKIFVDHRLVEAPKSAQDLIKFSSNKFCLIHDADRTLFCQLLSKLFKSRTRVGSS